MDKEHPVRHRLHFLEDVGRDQDRLRLAEFPDQRADPRDLVRVQTAGGFVEDQDLGVVQQRLRHGDALAVAFGQLADRLVRDRFERALRQHRLGAPFQLGRAHPSGLSEKAEQFGGGHVGVERAVLRQVTKMLGRRQSVFLHVDAGDPG